MRNAGLRTALRLRQRVGGLEEAGLERSPRQLAGVRLPGEATPTSRRVTALSEGVCTAPSAGGGAEPARLHGAGVT